MSKRIRKKPPSVAGLSTIRTEMKEIVHSLSHAHAKSRDPAEKQRISLAASDVEKRIDRLTKALARVRAFQQRKRGYHARIEEVDQRIQQTVLRAFRAGGRWLRKWVKL
jgi:uncharacterized protein (DUF4415 family)